MSHFRSRPTATTLLACGALLGAALAATGIVEKPLQDSVENPLARVDGELIGRGEFLTYLGLLARDKRNAMSAADRRHVLDRMIEERLLIARGLSIGLPNSDPKVRKTIVSAMIQTVISDSTTALPSAAQLDDFYRNNHRYFAGTDRLRVQRMIFRGSDGHSRATAAHAALATIDWQEVQRRFADRDLLRLPSSPLPLHKLRGTIGPSQAEAAAALTPGEYSQPLATGDGYVIVWLLDLQPLQIQPLEVIREEVVREYQRRAGDEALRDYLRQLRLNAKVEIDEAFLLQLDALNVSR